MTGVRLVFLIFGAMLLGFFGITIPGIRIAGGIVIAILGIRILFPQPVGTETIQASVIV